MRLLPFVVTSIFYCYQFLHNVVHESNIFNIERTRVQNLVIPPPHPGGDQGGGILGNNSESFKIVFSWGSCSMILDGSMQNNSEMILRIYEVWTVFTFQNYRINSKRNIFRIVFYYIQYSVYTINLLFNTNKARSIKIFFRDGSKSS